MFSFPTKFVNRGLRTCVLCLVAFNWAALAYYLVNI